MGCPRFILSPFGSICVSLNTKSLTELFSTTKPRVRKRTRRFKQERVIMATSSNSNTRHHIRSNSWPCRSHPITLRIREELNRLKTWEASSTTPTAEAICSGLSGLEELYKCIDELFNLPQTQQTLPGHRHSKWVDELLDGSVRLLDVCGLIREATSQIKENTRTLQSALRRRKGDQSIESSLTSYTSFRKKMKKDAKRLLAAFKQIDKKIEDSDLLLLDLNQEVLAMIRDLKEVRAMSSSVFQSVLLFSMPVQKPEQTKWSLVSKLMHKKKVACIAQHQNVNELEAADFAIYTLCSSDSREGNKMQIAQDRLEALETGIEGVEMGLEGMFRHLIKTRASLLNIISY